MASTPLLQAIAEAERAVGPGSKLHESLTASDLGDAINRVQAVARAQSTVLTELLTQVAKRQSAGGGPVAQLQAVADQAREAQRAVSLLGFTFGRFKQGTNSIEQEQKALMTAIEKVDAANAALLAGLRKLKPLVTQPRAARRGRGEIRAQIDRDAG